MSGLRRLLALTALLTAAPWVQAVTLSGAFDDPGNAALKGSDLGPASFVDEAAIANNVALYPLLVASAQTVRFHSLGHAAGGAEAYLSVFDGLGAFVGSSFFDPAIDFDVLLPLAAGDYTVAISVFVNLSFAENLGVGTLADGFTGLGVPAGLNDASYSVDVTLNGQPPAAPEPASLGLAVLAAAAALHARRRRAEDRADHLPA